MSNRSVRTETGIPKMEKSHRHDVFAKPSEDLFDHFHTRHAYTYRKHAPDAPPSILPSSRSAFTAAGTATVPACLGTDRTTNRESQYMSDFRGPEDHNHANDKLVRTRDLQTRDVPPLYLVDNGVRKTVMSGHARNQVFSTTYADPIGSDTEYKNRFKRPSTAGTTDVDWTPAYKSPSGYSLNSFPRVALGHPYFDKRYKGATSRDIGRSDYEVLGPAGSIAASTAVLPRVSDSGYTRENFEAPAPGTGTNHMKLLLQTGPLSPTSVERKHELQVQRELQRLRRQNPVAYHATALEGDPWHSTYKTVHDDVHAKARPSTVPAGSRRVISADRTGSGYTVNHPSVYEQLTRHYDGSGTRADDGLLLESERFGDAYVPMPPVRPHDKRLPESGFTKDSRIHYEDSLALLSPLSSPPAERSFRFSRDLHPTVEKLMELNEPEL